MNKLLVAIGIIILCAAARFTTDFFNPTLELPEPENHNIQKVKINGESLFPNVSFVETNLLLHSKSIKSNQREINTEKFNTDLGTIYKIASKSKDADISIFDDQNYLLEKTEKGVSIMNFDAVNKSVFANLEKLKFENFGLINPYDLDALAEIDMEKLNSSDILLRDPYLNSMQNYFDKSFDFENIEEIRNSYGVDCIKNSEIDSICWGTSFTL